MISYPDLCAHANRAYTSIIRSGHYPNNPSAHFIFQHAITFTSFGRYVAGSGWDEGPAGAGLDLLAENWADIASGAITGEELIKTVPGLWRRLMTESPMGDYAALLGSHMESLAIEGEVLELGAGVGATTHAVMPHVYGEYVATDAVPFPDVTVYDFNEPTPPDWWGRFDAIIGTNALHCARDPLATLNHLRDALAPGGQIILSEGSPTLHCVGGLGLVLPWPLTAFFGLFRGWWDVGGFRHRLEWEHLLGLSGYLDIGFRPLAPVELKYEMGGLVWGHV